MTVLEHVQDLHYHPECKSMWSLDEALEIKGGDHNYAKKGKKESSRYWFPREERLKKKYKVPSLTAYVLYEHHFKERPFRELAEETGTTHQSLIALVDRLRMPRRSRGEHARTERIKRGRERASKFFEIREEIYHKYVVLGEDIGSIAEKYGAAPSSIRKQLKKKGIKFSKKGHKNSLKGKSFDEFFGERKSRRIRKEMRDYREGKTIEETYVDKSAEEIEAIRRKMSKSARNRRK